MAFDNSSLSPTLFFTADQGPGPITLTHLESRRNDEDCYTTGHLILEAYERLLDSLLAGNEGSKRLQNGLAVAVAGLSCDEFNALSEHDQAKQRLKHVEQPLTPKELAPILIVYEGPKPNTDTPSTSGPFVFDKGPFDKEQPEYNTWARIWDDEMKSATAWGWTACSEGSQRLVIFLSGAFFVWPRRWKGLTHVASSRAKMICFLKVTLFHELAHYLRSLLFGVVDNFTSAKCIDYPRKGLKSGEHSDMGEGGRLAEAMAFGSVIDLCLDDKGKLRLVVFALDRDDTTIYEIPRNLEEVLFGQSFNTPINIQHISTLQPPLKFNMSDIGTVQGKKTHLITLPTFKSILNSSLPLVKDRTVETEEGSRRMGQELRPITGILADKIQAARPYLDLAKGSCVVVEQS